MAMRFMMLVKASNAAREEALHGELQRKGTERSKG
jgi:hypothetical protein